MVAETLKSLPRHRVVFYAGLVLLLLLFAAAFWLRWRAMDFRSGDYNFFLQRWYGAVWTQGQQGVLNVNFSNYPPLYLYLMRITQWVLPSTPSLYAVKAISLAGDALASVLVWRIARMRFGAQVFPPIFAALGMLLLPTVYTNSAQWAQCDILYGLCLLGTLLAAMRGRMVASLLWLGLGFAFKPHTIFLAPFLGVMLIARRAPVWIYPLPVLVYVVSLLPAAFFGSDFHRLLWLYADAASSSQRLYSGAANIYVLLGYSNYYTESVAKLGYAAFALFSLCYLAMAWRILVHTLKAGGMRVLSVGALLAYISTLYVPFFLPHMHDRYFFAADLFAYVLAVCHWPWALAAALQQFSSLAAYAVYFRANHWFGGLDSFQILWWGAAVNAGLLLAASVKMIALFCNTFPGYEGVVERLIGRFYARVNKAAERIDD